MFLNLATNLGWAKALGLPATWCCGGVGNRGASTKVVCGFPSFLFRRKTGTSYGYRDAWSVGFDGRMPIGVWVGRPDGAPVLGLVGRTAAALILFDAFARIGKLSMPLPKPPKGALVASNAKLPLPLRRFRPGGELVHTGSEQAPHIQFPLNGSRIEIAGAGLRDARQGGRRRASDDHADQWRLGGRNRWPAPASGPPGPGFAG